MGNTRGSGPKGGGAGSTGGGSGADATHAGNVSSGGISGHANAAAVAAANAAAREVAIANAIRQASFLSSFVNDKEGWGSFSIGQQPSDAFSSMAAAGGWKTVSNLGKSYGWQQRANASVNDKLAGWGRQPLGAMETIGYHALSAIDSVKERPGGIVGGIGTFLTGNPIAGAAMGFLSNLTSGWMRGVPASESVGPDVMKAAPSAVVTAAIAEIGEKIGGPIGKAVMSGLGKVVGNKVASTVANNYSDWSGTPEVEAAGSSVYSGESNTKALINALAIRRAMESSKWRTTA